MAVCFGLLLGSVWDVSCFICYLVHRTSTPRHINGQQSRAYNMAWHGVRDVSLTLSDGFVCVVVCLQAIASFRFFLALDLVCCLFTQGRRVVIMGGSVALIVCESQGKEKKRKEKSRLMLTHGKDGTCLLKAVWRLLLIRRKGGVRIHLS